ncbi:MAG: pantoate kinase [Candidatus Hermodarchaeota archaeon]
MSKKTKKIIVEVPHRISGFFEIVDKINGVKISDPERIGSRGAGLCLSAKGKTEVITENLTSDNEFKVNIYINGNKVNQSAETTSFIVNYIKKLIRNPVKIRINHFFDLPVGCGYGASGAGALGTIFGLNDLYNLGLSDHEKGRIAHIAEVENHTGLGTICGQLNGGIGIVKEPGYPCIYERINIPPNIKIICGSFGMIHTKSILTDPVLNDKIKEAGKIALRRLIQNPNIKSFMNVSLEFVKNSEILDILKLLKVKELIDDLNRLNIIGASMNQLGRSVFAICGKEKETEVLNVMESYSPEIKIFSTFIHQKKSIVIRKGKEL